MSITARYAAAQIVAAKAGRVAHDYFVRRSTLAIEAKGAQDFVSHADRAVEALIRAEFQRDFPEDAFLGEESATGFAGTDANLWIVDPIDGTHNFLRGVRYYCISIAYVEQGRREIGVVCDSEYDEVFHARRGHGAWCARRGGEERLHVSACDALSRAFVCLGHHDRGPDPRYIAIRQRMMDRGVAMRNMGAGALQLAHVAAGRYDGFVELSLNAWDAMAGLLLTEEAGGHIAPFPGPGGLRTPAPVLACAPGIAADLTELVGVW